MAFGQFRISFGNDAGAVHDHQVLDASGKEHLADGDPCSTATIDDHLNLIDFFSCQAQGIVKGSQNNNRGPVLVIMEDRNVQHLFQAAFDFEAARRADVFQVDPAERRCDGSNVRDDFFNILRIQGNRNGIHIPEAFEQGRFAFHNRNSCFRSDIT